MGQILLIGDECALGKNVAAILESCEHEVTSCENVFEALKIIKNERYDLIITDMRLPMQSNSTVDDEGGLQIIEATMDANIWVPIIVITEFGSIENAVDAMRLGACDYLTKPIDYDELKMKIQRSINQRFNPSNYQIANPKPETTAYIENIIGESEAIQKLKSEICTVADNTATVLIQGESGTGKELVAKAIHHSSPRRDMPLITVNCAAFTSSLIEDELFGHRKGSFSGAITDRRGAVEEAKGGSLFLDEIGEMPLDMQPRLLRVLEQKEVKRIGENIAKTVDVRIIAATNKKLEQEVSAGRFRPDLFERLNVIVINLPPLREIKEDIPLLIEHFIRIFRHESYNERFCLTANSNSGICQKTAELGDRKSKIQRISDAALDMLMYYDWPRNIRELKNTIERTLIFMEGDVITEDNLRMNNCAEPVDDESLQNEYPLYIPIGYSLEEIKLEVIRQTLIAFNGNKTHTAKALDISTSTLWKALKTIKNRKDRKSKIWKSK